MTVTLLLPAAHRQLDREDSFLGERTPAEFITREALESAVGITQGTAIYTGQDAWLEFRYGGKELFVAKKPMRHTVSATHLNSLGIVKGQKVITINDKQYKVRLLTGGDGRDPTAVPGGEWDALIRRVHTSWPALTRWANYSHADLAMTGNNGGVCLCQERYLLNAQDAGQLARGYPDSVVGIWYMPDNGVNNYYGWRPVLERV